MYCRELDDRRQRVVRLDPDQAMGVESPPRENSGLRAVVALEHSRHRGVVGHCLRERTVRVTRRPCDGRVQGAQRDRGSGMDGLQLQQQRAGQRRGGGKG